MSPTRVWVLSDGAAGNANPALALGRRLGEVERILHLQPRWPWRWAAPRRLPLAERAFGETFAAALAATPPDLAVGCGRQAALATRLLRQRGARVIQLLAPRLHPRHWDLVVAPAHDSLRGDNVITTLGSLHAVDADWLAAGRADWPALGRLPSPRTLLLLGGPTAAAPLGEPEWRRIADILRQWQQRDGGSLLVSSSRRTPDWLRRAARAAFAGQPGLQWHAAADGANPYPGMLGWAERIVVTADSVNLLSEACAASAPVHALLPTAARGRLAEFHRRLLEGGHLLPLQADSPGTRTRPLAEMDAVVAAVEQQLARNAFSPPRPPDAAAPAG